MQATQGGARAGNREVGKRERQVGEIPGECADVGEDHRLKALALVFNNRSGVPRLSDSKRQVPGGRHRWHDLAQQAMEVVGRARQESKSASTVQGPVLPDVMPENTAPYRDAVIRAFPDLAGATFRPLTMGWQSLALDVDDRLIFKFPRNQEAEQALRREARILATVRPHLTMPVPDLELFEKPMLFSRHDKIPGEHLLHDQYEKLTVEACERLAETLARFHAELHALAPETMRRAGATAIKPWLSLAEIRAKALPLVPTEHRALCQRTLDLYGALAPDPLGTTYGFFDGHGWNMAFDHARQQLNGVYDFADSGFGPMHQDFIYSTFVSFDLTRRIIDRYTRMTGRTIDKERVALLTGVHRLSELAELAEDSRHVTMARDNVAFWVANALP